MEPKDKISRRSFIFSASFFSAFLLTGFGFIRKVFADSVDLVRERNRGTYGRDAAMALRKSQDNPEVRQIYNEFLEHPNSHKSHELLHTTYTDRSSKIARLRQRGVNIPI